MTHKTVTALVKPEILAWARKSAGYRIEDVESSSGLSAIRDWESGKTRPTINQLRFLADIYQRPLAVFYLQKRPTDFQTVPDNRRLPCGGKRRVSPRLHLQVRAMQERREIALECLSMLGEQTPEFSIAATIDDAPEEAGARIRKHLRVTGPQQFSWENMSEAFNGWRSAIEDAGALVFQLDGIETKEASGVAIAKKALPTIAVNRSDMLPRRTFSLLHEFAHLLLAESGISECHGDTDRPPVLHEIEKWCNAVAVAALMPRDMLLEAKAVRTHEAGNPIWKVEELDSLSDSFKVSKVAVVRRLLMLGLTDQDYCARREREHARVHGQCMKRGATQSEEPVFGGHHSHHEAFCLLGHHYVRLVLAAYQSDLITLRDVSDYLDLKTRHIPQVERVLLSAPAR